MSPYFFIRNIVYAMHSCLFSTWLLSYCIIANVQLLVSVSKILSLKQGSQPLFSHFFRAGRGGYWHSPISSSPQTKADGNCCLNPYSCIVAWGDCKACFPKLGITIQNRAWCQKYIPSPFDSILPWYFIHKSLFWGLLQSHTLRH